MATSETRDTLEISFGITDEESLTLVARSTLIARHGGMNTIMQYDLHVHVQHACIWVTYTHDHVLLLTCV